MPSRLGPGKAARVHLAFRPNAAQSGHWNNESTPLRSGSPGPRAGQSRPDCSNQPRPQPESVEVRRLDFEVMVTPAVDRKNPHRSLRFVQHLRAERAAAASSSREDLSVELDIAK